MDRRTFLARAGIAAAWAGIPITISCSDDDDDGAGPDDGDVAGVVTGAGHSHDGAVVTAAQIEAGDEVTLTLTGSGHVHTVNLTAQHVLDIGAGTQVVVNTVADATGHIHVVTFN